MVLYIKHIYFQYRATLIKHEAIQVVSIIHPSNMYTGFIHIFK